jgi:hypothetical protein
MSNRESLERRRAGQSRGSKRDRGRRNRREKERKHNGEKLIRELTERRKKFKDRKKQSLEERPRDRGVI